MTPEKKSLDRLLQVVRDNPPTTLLLGDDEIAKILVRCSQPGTSRETEHQTPNRRLLMGAIAFLMLAVAGTIVMIDQADPGARPGSQTGHPDSGSSSNAAATMRPDTPGNVSAPADTEVEQKTEIGRSSSVSPSQRRNASPTTVGPTNKRQARGIDLVGATEVFRNESEPTLNPQDRSKSISAAATNAVERMEPPNERKRMLPDRISFLMDDATKDLYGSERDVSGIRYVELTTEEVKKLGVSLTNGTLEVFGEERREIADWVKAGLLPGYENAGTEAIVRFRATIDTTISSVGDIPNPTPERYSSVAPIVVQCQYISDIGYLYRVMIYFNRSPLLKENGGGLSGEEMDLLAGYSGETRLVPQIMASPSLNRLIAVHVLPDDHLTHSAGGRAADIHLWYLPTTEFIDLLPDRYRDALRKEVATIAAVQREKLPPGAACERLTGQPTYLDLCRTSSGALQAGSIAPNPAHDNITVGFHVTEPRGVSLSLHDMNGRFIRTLVELLRVDLEQKVNLPVRIDGVKSGIYLVVVRSDRGEQLVQRLIVQ